MSIKIIPCPFCGGDAILQKEIEQSETPQIEHEKSHTVPYKTIGYSVRCFYKQTGCDIKPCTPKYETEQEAIICWNRRYNSQENTTIENGAFVKIICERCTFYVPFSMVEMFSVHEVQDQKILTLGYKTGATRDHDTFQNVINHNDVITAFQQSTRHG